MTVSSTTSKVSYTGNGLTTAFAVPFYFLEAADLQVILRSGTTETVQALSSQYTVTGAGVETGGTVTMLVAPAAGTTLTIRRNIAATQETDLLPNDRLPAETLETALDKVTMLTQQLGEESARSLKYPASDAPMSAQVPAASARASKFLSFDSNGLPVATVGVDASLDIFTQSGTGAVPRSVNDKLRDMVSVKDFGAIGYATTTATLFRPPTITGQSPDDTSAIQSAMNSGARKVIFGEGRFYQIKNTITIPPGVDVDFCSSVVVYNGPTDRPAFIHGSSATANTARLDNIAVAAYNISWSNNNYVGFRALNLIWTHVNTRWIKNFTIGYECYALGYAYAHVVHILGEFQTNKVGIALTCDGSAPPLEDYTNENTFFGGDITNQSDGGTLGASYGIWFRRVNNGYTGHSGNRFYGMCFQPGNVVGVDRLPIFLDGVGNFNYFGNFRYESGNGPTMIVKGANLDVSGTSNTLGVGNVADIQCFSPSGGAITPDILELGTARLNYVYSTNEPQYHDQEIVFSDLTKLVKSYSANNTSVMGGLCAFTNSSPTPALSVVDGGVGLNVLKDHVEITGNWGIGFFVECEGAESFSAFSKTQVGYVGRLNVNLYDASFNLLTNSSPSYPDMRSGYSALYSPYSTSFGGSYNPQNDSNEFNFTVSTNVKYIRVFITGGTNPSRVSSFGVRRLTKNKKPLRVFSGISTNPMFHYAGADPDAGNNGIYSLGDMAVNAAAAGGSASYWQCTTAGRLAPAWIASTAYTAGKLVLNDTDKIYECVTGGTSAGSGGPTGTGTNISDGGCVWNYLSPKAAFSAGANL
jgi:hypothetical protein